jgi:fused signal recognition particle receptor
MALLQKFRAGLRKSSAKLASEIQRIVSRAPRLDAEALEELEAALLAADLGVATTTAIIERVRQAGNPDVLAIARTEIERELSFGGTRSVASATVCLGGHDGAWPSIAKAKTSPTVILLAGVNGTGKTTSAAKLAHWLKEQGNTVLLAACDTFRAAAIEQLQLWGRRVGCDVVAGQYGADSAAVAFDALDAAINRGTDYLVIDTAGRLHTKKNLMEEMKKMHRSLQKRLSTAPHEVLLVLDATTGNNALAQARQFHDALGVTGLVITKLDGTAKGGIVVAIARELNIPVKFVGLGEQVDDLQPFDPKQFAEALLGNRPA